MDETNKSLGFIKLFRSFMDWEWYQDGNTMRVFLHCLLKANHKDKRWRGITVLKGSFISSRKQLAIELNLSEQNIRTALDHLKSTGEITTKSTRQYTVYTVNNWNLFQEGNQQANQQLTSNQPAGNQRVTTNKNDKNEKNDKNDKNSLSKGAFDPLERVREIFPSSSSAFLSEWEAYLEMRATHRMKVTTSHMVSCLAGQLKKAASTEKEQIAVLQQATAACYGSLCGPDRKQKTKPNLPDWYEDKDQQISNLSEEEQAEVWQEVEKAQAILEATRQQTEPKKKKPWKPVRRT